MGKGFTLLELLIVIAIIAILATILIVVLDPAETLKKARDSQRMSDLSSLKTALGIYLTSKKSPQLDGISGTAQNLCIGGAGLIKLWLSFNGAISDTAPAAFTGGWATTTVANSSLTNGSGWIPVNLGDITGGSPISNLPIDPTNVVANATSTAAVVTNEALMYRYACNKSPLSFEINAYLESAAYGPGGDEDKAAKDGGNNSKLFEMGNSLSILPGTDDF